MYNVTSTVKNLRGKKMFKIYIIIFILCDSSDK